MAVQIETVCNKCGTTFQREAKRGRPALRCESCRGVTKIVTIEPKRKLKDTPTKGNDRYSTALVVDMLESGDWDVLLTSRMAGGMSKAQAIAAIIKSIGG